MPSHKGNMDRPSPLSSRWMPAWTGRDRPIAEHKAKPGQDFAAHQRLRHCEEPKATKRSSPAPDAGSLRSRSRPLRSRSGLSCRQPARPSNCRACRCTDCSGSRSTCSCRGCRRSPSFRSFPSLVSFLSNSGQRAYDLRTMVRNQAKNSDTIGWLAKSAGVGVETVRYYQRRGLLPEPARPPAKCAATAWRTSTG